MDASCGPSNGMKSLQRHFDHDSSLHQSRLHSTPSSSTSFRQAPSREALEQARIEEAAFRESSGRGDWVNAFRDALPQHNNFSAPEIPSPASLQQLRQQQVQQHQAQHQQHRLQDEFLQQQRISQTQNQSSGQVLGQGQGQGSWGTEFLAQQPSLQVSQYPRFAGQPSFATPSFDTQSMHTAQSMNMSDTTTGFSEAAFAEAFAEAESSLQRSHEQHVERDLVTGSSEYMAHNQEEEMRLHLNQSVTETKEEIDKRVEADALSQTAGELIDNLREEKSPKFRQSQFMALMHKLRDKEVVVEENKMVNAQSGEEVGDHKTVNVDAAYHSTNDRDHDQDAITMQQL